MNSLYSITASFLICSFAVLVINYFLPKGNMKKISSFVMTIFTVTVLLSSVKDTNMPVFSAETQTEDISVNQSVITSYKTRLRLAADKILNDFGITDYEMVINLSKDDNQNIVIDEFSVKSGEDFDKEALINEFKSKLGFCPSIDSF